MIQPIRWWPVALTALAMLIGLSRPANAAPPQIPITGCSVSAGVTQVGSYGCNAAYDGSVTTAFQFSVSSVWQSVVYTFPASDVGMIRVYNSSASRVSWKLFVGSSGLSATLTARAWTTIDVGNQPGITQIALRPSDPDNLTGWGLGEVEVYGVDDVTPPDAPTGLVATPLDDAIMLSWTPSQASDLQGYRVYRDGVQLISLGRNESYTDQDVTPGVVYSYTVTAYDAAGNESEHTQAVSASTHDETPPAPPSGLVITPDYGAVTLAWDAGSEPDIHGYRVYRDGQQVGDVAVPAFTDTGVVPGVSYTYTVTAYDTSGNESGHSDPTSTAPLPFPEPPGPPVGLRATPGSRSISLAWSRPDSTVEVDRYHVYRDDVQVGTTTQTTWRDTGLQPGREYAYSVTAANDVGESPAASITAAPWPSGAVEGVRTDLSGLGSSLRSAIAIVLPFFLLGASLIVARVVLGVGLIWVRARGRSR